MVVNALALATAILSGCGSHQDDTVMVAPHAAPVSFTGTIFKPLVGQWSSKDHDEVWNLHADGSDEISAVTHGPGGARHSDIKGDWRADGQSLLLKYVDNGGTPIVIKYQFTQSGKTLKVVQGGTGIKTILVQSK